MATTASTLYEIARRLRGLRSGAATGGSTTTLVDAAREEPDGYFNGGTIFFLSGNNAGKTAAITDWDRPTNTFTIPTQPEACAAGDRYAVLDVAYSRETLLGGLNAALAELGPFDAYDDSSLVTAADTAYYALPAGVSGIKRVEIAASKASPYGWVVTRYWREVAGKLWLSEYRLPPADYKIRIWHAAPHAEVSADADVVTDDVHPVRLATLAVYLIAHARSTRPETATAQSKELETQALQLSMSAMKSYPIRRMPKDRCWSDYP